MNAVDACNEIFRRFPDLKHASEGRTAGEIVANFVRAFSASAEEPRRDALGPVVYEGQEEPREPGRDPRCRCSSPPQFCSCAGAKYDLSDRARDEAIAAELAHRYGWPM